MYLLKLTWHEFSLLMKEKVGAIWTFVFPVVLLLALVPIYESVGRDRTASPPLEIDVCGPDELTSQFSADIKEVFDGEISIKSHKTSDFYTSGYRVELSESCSESVYVESNFRHATIFRYSNDVSHDSFVSTFVSYWSSNKNAPSIAVQDVSRTELKMSVAQYLLSGILAITLTSTCLFGVAVAVVGMRSANLFKKYKLFPVTNVEIYASLLLSRLLLMFTFCLVYIAFGFWYFEIPIQSLNLVRTLPLLLLAAMTLISISLAISSFFATQSAISPFVSLLYMATILIGNIFFPTKLLPDWVNLISEYYPVRIFVDTFRQSAYSIDMGINYWNSIGLLLVWGILSAVIAIRFFSPHANKRG